MSNVIRPVNQSQTPKVEGNNLYRFNEQSLAVLRTRLPKPGVNADTTPLQAGFLLGVAHVLQMLQDGWTV